jgi:hypothetical protein
MDSRPQSWILVRSVAGSASGNDLETYRQRAYDSFSTVVTGATRNPTPSSGGSEATLSHIMATATNQNRHRRIAFCECGAQLAGESEQELFNAAQRHLAHRHPQLLGALELDTVHQMAEDVGGH